MGYKLSIWRGAFVEIEFTKLQGNGNDFILIDEYETGGYSGPDERRICRIIL